jgi:hypothetical protein
MVTSADRLGGGAFSAASPEMGADSNGTTLLKHDCRGAGGFLLGGMPAMLNGVAMPQVEKMLAYASSYFYSMTKCKQKVLKQKAVDTLAQWRNKIEAYSPDMWLYRFDTSAGKPAYGEDKGGELGAAKWFGWNLTKIPKGNINLPNSCTYASYSRGGSCKIAYTALSELFDGGFDILGEVKRCPATAGEPWTAERVPAFALSVRGNVAKSLQAPQMCNKDADCPTLSKCKSLDALTDKLLVKKMKDPMGIPVFGTNAWATQCSSAMIMKKDIRRLLMEMGDQRYDDKSDLSMCIMDYEKAGERASDWVKKLAPEEAFDKVTIPYLQATSVSAIEYGIPTIDPAKEIKFALPKMSLKAFRNQRKKFRKAIALWVNSNKWFKEEISMNQIFITFPREAHFVEGNRRLDSNNLGIKFQLVTDEKYSVDPSDSDSITAKMTASNKAGGANSFGAAAGDSGLKKEGGGEYSEQDSKDIPPIVGVCGGDTGISCGNTDWAMIGGIIAAALIGMSAIGAAVGYKMGLFGGSRHRNRKASQKFENENVSGNASTSSVEMPAAPIQWAAPAAPIQASSVNIVVRQPTAAMPTAMASPVTSTPWVKYFDENTKQNYWHNTQTGETSWKDPNM